VQVTEPPSVSCAPRHSVVVRISHWIIAAGVLALLASGIAILLAHPRLYWGETGTVGDPALLELPLPFVFGPSGWGRSLHFLAAWVCVLTGLSYALSGVFTGHFTRTLLPSNFGWPSFKQTVLDHLHPRRLRNNPGGYNILQRLAYSAVVFALFPLMIVSGLAMSPAITSVVPLVVTMFGGQQSARTIHFFAAMALMGFVVVHAGMVSLAGFGFRIRAMTIGHHD
jgi:thiosulfate reductase cytochrome b subunit